MRRKPCRNTRRREACSMSSRCHKLACFVSLGAATAFAQGDCCIGMQEAAPAAGIPLKRVLRVTADPNNLPFSNERREGFENKIAELIAKDLGAHLEYMWWPQRRGFFRETIGSGRADLVMGVPVGFQRT